MSLKNEKRKQKRKDCAVLVDAQRGSNFAQTQTTDISRGGIGFVSAKEIALNQKVAVEIDFNPEGDSLLALGDVCWVHPTTNLKGYRFGVKIKEFLSGSKSRFNNLLKTVKK